MAAHHHAHDLRDRHIFEIARANFFTVAQHRDTIPDLVDFLEPVRDVDDRHATFFELVYDAEQTRDFFWSQRRGRLIHDQHFVLVGERLRDLDKLHLRDT